MLISIKMTHTTGRSPDVCVPASLVAAIGNDCLDPLPEHEPLDNAGLGSGGSCWNYPR
jgi:hypothetical protein